MREKIMSLIVLFTLCVGASAQKVAVADVEALPGETVSLTMQLDTDGGSYEGLEFDIQFPQAGFTTTNKANNITAAGWDGAFTIGDVGGVGIENLVRCGVLSYSATEIPGTGLLDFGTVEFTVSDEMILGDYIVTLKNMTLIGDGRVSVPETSFTLHVVSAHTVILDENSSTMPEAATGVNVKVKRTIKANTWSTICLPFVMTEDQVKAAFGDDVQLGDFDGYIIDDDATRIDINFKNVDISDGLEANHPYIIMVKENISDFSVDNVDIDPEDEPTVAAVKRSKKQWSEMIGTYVIKSELGEDGPVLFLSNNKIYYAVGYTTMKAYRAYFDFYDELEDKAGARINLSFGDDVTRIENVDFLPVANGRVYSLGGQCLGDAADMPKLSKGVYIIDGKKKIIK